MRCGAIWSTHLSENGVHLLDGEALLRSTLLDQLVQWHVVGGVDADAAAGVEGERQLLLLILLGRTWRR